MPGNTNALNTPTGGTHKIKMLEQLISQDEQLVFIDSTDIRENGKPLTPKVVVITDFQNTKSFMTCFRIISQFPQSENEVNKSKF